MLLPGHEPSTLGLHPEIRVSGTGRARARVIGTMEPSRRRGKGQGRQLFVPGMASLAFEAAISVSWNAVLF